MHPSLRKKLRFKKLERNIQEALQPFNRPVPQPFPEKTRDEYRRRALPILQNYAPGMQDVKFTMLVVPPFDMIERQTFEAAAREAQRPTQVPEGELREIKRFDQSGRVSLEFYGKPSVWMSQFAPDRRRLVGIRTETERGYRPFNLG
jgi:hypothetical protein